MGCCCPGGRTRRCRPHGYHRATEDFYQAHPDWFCIDREGKPYMSQGRYFSCVNSGCYKEYIPAVLEEICERYHPEAFADKKALLSRSKFVFTDHQNRDKLNGFEQNMGNDLLLHMTSSENLVIPESMANYVRGNHTFRLSANPKEETRTWMYSGAAGGISPWFHHIGGGTRDKRQFETPVEFMNWHAENEDALYDRKTLANTAVVWSQENAVRFTLHDAWSLEKLTAAWREVLFS